MIKRKVEAWNADPISLQSARRQEGPLYPFSGRVCYSISFHLEKFLAWHSCWKLCLSFFTFFWLILVLDGHDDRECGYLWLSSRLQEYGEWVDHKMTKCSTEGKNICSAKAWFSICRRCGSKIIRQASVMRFRSALSIFWIMWKHWSFDIIR